MTVAAMNMMIDGVIDALTKALITDVGVEDVTRAETVRAGKLQADPTNGTGINVLVWTAEEDDPNELWTEDRQRGLTAPTYEIGGGATYMHRLKLHVIMHFKGYRSEQGRIDARVNAWVVMSRIRHALHQMDIPKHPITLQPKDDFGEVIIEIQIGRFFLKESGGSGNYIWRGEVYFGFLTETPTRFS